MAKLKLSLSEFNTALHSPEEEYLALIQELEDSIKENVHASTEIYEGFSISRVEKGVLLTLLCISRPLRVLEEDITADLMFQVDDVDSYSDFFDKVIKLSRSKNLGERTLELIQSISWALSELAAFASANVLLQRGVTVNPYDIPRLAKKDPVFQETLDFRHEEDEGLVDIETKIQKQRDNLNKAIERILLDQENSIRKLIQAGSGINKNQLGEVIGVIGYKPDIRGRVIPKPINSSFSRGLQSVEDYYINAMGARKALITSKTQVRQSGYLNRKIMILTEDVRIEDVDDCQSKEYIRLKIGSKKMLEFYIGRFYVTNAETGELGVITEDSTFLVGQTILLRSPITCRLHTAEKDHVCKTCYGQVSWVNLGMNVGSIANLVLTEPMTQKLLSTKHTLQVEVQNFQWSEDFKKYFVLDESAGIVPKDIDTRIYIDQADLIEKENYNINRYSTERFFFLNKNKERVYIDSPVRLILPDRYFSDINIFYDPESETYSYTLADLTDDCEHLLTLTIKNSGIAEPLLKIERGLENNSFLQEKCENDPNLVLQTLVGYLLQSGTHIQSVHLEVILECMIKKQEDGSYIIRKITDSIYYSNSPVKSFLYQLNSKQVLTDFNDLFAKKGDSEFDRLFLEVNDDA